MTTNFLLLLLSSLTPENLTQQNLFFLFFFSFVFFLLGATSLLGNVVSVAIAAIYLVHDPVTTQGNFVQRDGECEKLTTFPTVAHQRVRIISEGSSLCHFDKSAFPLFQYTLVCSQLIFFTFCLALLIFELFAFCLVCLRLNHFHFT